MAKTATQVAQKWATNLSGASQSIIDGVNSVTEAPGVAAAAMSKEWLKKVTAAENKWKENVSAVPLADWKRAMLGKGVNRMAEGAREGQSKMQKFMEQLLPITQQVHEEAKAMKKQGATPMARIQKMLDTMTKFKYKKA